MELLFIRPALAALGQSRRQPRCPRMVPALCAEGPSPLDQLQKRLDFSEVVRDAGVNLQAMSGGTSFRGLCPFHQEKTPSFMVSPEKGTYHCFGCRAKGNIFHFVRDTEGLDTNVFEAARLLAERYGHNDLIPLLDNQVLESLSPEAAEQRRQENEEKRDLVAVMESALDFFQKFLSDQPAAAPARDYLSSERRYSNETVQLFRLGMAPLAWDRLVTESELKPEILVKAGLARFREKKENGAYDFFRGRIIVPIRDTRGNVLAFGSRVIPDLGDAGMIGSAKYINSPDTLLFRKSTVLFGAHELRLASDGTLPASVTIVEGYLDVLTLHQAGVTNTVASLGTGLTVDQLQLAVKLTSKKRIVINFDNDDSGREAMRRLGREVLHLPELSNVNIRIASLPGVFKDPDEFLLSHSGDQYFTEVVERALPWEEWCLRDFMNYFHPASIDTLSRGIQDLGELISTLMPSSSEYHKTARILYARKFGTELATAFADTEPEFIVSRLISNIATSRKEWQSEKNGYPSRKYAPKSYQSNKASYTGKKAYTNSMKSGMPQLTLQQSQKIVAENKRRAREQIENMYPQALEDLDESSRSFLSALIFCPDQRPRAVDMWIEKDLTFFKPEYAWLFEKIASSSLPADELFVQLMEDEQATELLPLVEDLFRLETHFVFPIRKGAIVVELNMCAVERYWCEVKRLRLHKQRAMIAHSVLDNYQEVRKKAELAGTTLATVIKQYEAGERGQPGELVDSCWQFLEENTQNAKCDSNFSKPMEYLAERGSQAKRRQLQLHSKANSCDRSLDLPDMSFGAMLRRQSERREEEKEQERERSAK